ncbi:MAG: hypothetical protein OSA99_05610 [Acidimicrobiales bacterium]|nr:hypothetical protein [Acidimicrobiales bacterium]
MKAREVIAMWNAEHAERLELVLVPVGWETDAVPEWGSHPQEALNRQLVDGCDLIVGVFWARLGSATPSAPSGTAEEIKRCADSGKPVLLYFCRRDVALDQVDPDQLIALRAFEADIREQVLFDSYGDDAEFSAKLRRGLTKVVNDQFLMGDRDDLAEEPEASATARPARGTRLTSPPVPKQQPRLAARLESHGRSRRLVLSNSGTVEMTGVDVEVPAEASSFHLVTNELPIDILRPGERVALLASLVMGGGVSIFDVTVSGSTPDGERASFPSKISI